MQQVVATVRNLDEGCSRRVLRSSAMPATNSCINGSGRSAKERIKSKRRLRVSTLPTSSAICSSNSSSSNSSLPKPSASAPQVFCHMCVGGGGCICHVCFNIRVCGGGGASAIAAYPHTPVLIRDFSTNDFSTNYLSTSHVQDMTHSLYIRHLPHRSHRSGQSERHPAPAHTPHPVAWGEDQIKRQDEDMRQDEVMHQD